MLQFRQEGIYCIPGNFFIDPWQPVDFAVVTHGHADHARWGMKNYLCHHFTVPILKSRIGIDISVQGLSYHESIHINGVKVSLHPAGHIIGSAQIRMEYKGKVCVVSGDYKTQNDGLSAPFESIKCHEFVSESTFGLPIYHWLSVEQQNQHMQNWVLQNQTNGKTSVFIGYSLGKAQRIMKALVGIAPLHVHYSIAKLNQAYESVGVKLPPYNIINLQEDIKQVDTHIVIVPPALADSKVIHKIPHMANAICSGWMQVRGSRRWRSADAGFAISDHADWQGLLDVIKATEAEKVYITHGQTAVFTKYLNEIGILAEEVRTVFGNEEEELEKT
ncbi:ligase-associated DNA damage response exonuclease [Sphingobacterium sp. FBM7-1]|uniref:ligase-associated DNA damage response exonuclease n=1 Tax=Sphingobacterium sp. FBM7-1 TaxID=2886688 RepID=UPI001D113C66|nr:ligase-associated DNA damage response exonuclease [Sphingobacterium sp. FBM7-1]MCC2600254.1 ligase-associated DNA damage response exonuclease [Sphingobacterium sp. FBM7-1]